MVAASFQPRALQAKGGSSDRHGRGCSRAPGRDGTTRQWHHWQSWFTDNYRSFRRTLLHHRDGARLHAGTFPSAEGLDRLKGKFAFLVAYGVPERDAQMAMLAASRFTVGGVLEEQAHAEPEPTGVGSAIDPDEAFEAGLRLLVHGLDRRRDASQ
ncbi:TetR/AcrR family transcriptional regulator C-terminal domain-containing protein [Allobranchiibius sp. GilTou73]|uniref:TetR/AcrR family transcriptional regulator C-terminal domain-containing protein n=1 Tax=Allobranchiibius sp. GilTou73 TaxID=2904523 RepID=UPI001F1C9F27|nr:TetR/AcrR family transcriptional regulator C-terminal domain-containing protein [Allobranchiibius sp. GilTou73]UIJ34320.1 TetR/AcrR family transcriptional regulator C-terminal domain-containing protein [Allobranchiibius sp. GilTou73]